MQLKCRSGKLISLIMVIILICQMLPMQTFAAEEEPETDTLGGAGIVLFDTVVAGITTGSGIVIQGSSTVYTDLKSAVLDAQDNDVLVITGTVTESGTVFITKDITLIAGVGGGTVNSSYGIYSHQGNKLTLGSGDSSGFLLTLNTGVTVTKGQLLIQEGVSIRSDGYTVQLLGCDSVGEVNGGEIISYLNEALYLDVGAKITEIKNGRIHGYRSAVMVSGQDTEIEIISGGSFSNDNGTGKRSCVYVEHGAKIGTITGGAQFKASYGSALMILRGGRVDEISGGDFISVHESNTTDMMGRGITVGALDSYGYTSIGKISGGSFSGEMGVYILNLTTHAAAEIGEITGGNFYGKYRGLQIENGTNVNKISGGSFKSGGDAIFNYGSIGIISGNPQVASTGATALNNYYFSGKGGTIEEISGGTFTGTDNGVSNPGTINKISGGVFAGKYRGISSKSMTSSHPQTINKITGGVFYGEYFGAIELSKPVSLEPDLTTEVQGAGRYLCANGKIFNNDSLVNLPAGYHMSTMREPVSSIYDYNGKLITKGFGYLTTDYVITYDSNDGTGSMADQYSEYNETVAIAQNGFTRDGYAFAGWNTRDDGSGAVYNEGEAYTMLDDLELYAQWQRKTTPVEPKIAAYRVEHYKQQADGTYVIAAEDTQFPLYGGIGATVTASAIAYEHYSLNESASTLSGEVIIPTQESGELKLLTLKLYYDLDTFTVSYDMNGGTGDSGTDYSTQTVKYGETVKAKTAPALSGYKFTGWSDGTNICQPGGELIIIGNITLTAQWQREMTPVEPKVAAYRVEHYKQQTDGTYVIAAEDTQFPLYGEIGATVTASAIAYGHYSLNESASILSGEVIIPAQEDGELKMLTLKLYYDLDTFTVSYDMNGGIGDSGTDYSTQTVKYGETVKAKTAPALSGYKFTGWSDGTNICQPGGDLTILGNITLTAQWEKTGGNGGSGGNGGGSIALPETEIPAAGLEKEDHFAYMMGYPENEIRPLNQITREEVAMIFYRLLTDESRNSAISDNNPFADMKGHDWSNRAVSTLYNAGILKGYEDGSFRPSSYITRAEFAAIASRFDKLEEAAGMFTDISGHWAENLINSANKRGWIKGYEDGTFRPDNNITRAEAMSMINNVLGRKVSAENIHPDAKQWIDNPEGTWYHEIVLEASNSHNYVYDENNNERWVELKPDKIWP